MLALDDLDKKILKQLSVGISSYEELARYCHVTRNTVYRRIAALERQGIIKNTIKCTINFDQLDITPVCVVTKIAQSDLGKACQLLSSHKKVRLLIRSYGDHNLYLIAYCQRGKEGEVIESITTVLEHFSAEDIEVSVGFIWEKNELTTIEDQPEIGQRINPVVENKIP